MDNPTIEARLFEALRSGQSSSVSAMLAAQPALATISFKPTNLATAGNSMPAHPEQYANAPLGQTPLHLAAWNGEQRLVKQLLELGADPNARDLHGATPLHAMVRWVTRPDIMSMLLEHGAEINAVDAAGQTALHLAASCIRRPGHQWGNHRDLANVLIAQGATVDIFSAIILDFPEQAATLLQNDPTLVNARTTGNQTHPPAATPLHVAADRGNLAMAALLLEQHADPHSLDAHGRPELYLAAHAAGTRKQQATPELAALLLADSNVAPILTASLLGDVLTLRDVLANDASHVNVVDQAGHTALHLAAWNGQEAAVALLLAHGADVAAQTKRNQTALQLAVAYGHNATAEILLNHGARPDALSAAMLGRVDLLASLLKHNPETGRTPNRYGRTPLRLAVEREHTAVVEFLLAHGVKPDLWLAAGMGDLAQVKALLEADRCALHQRDQWGYTALHWASKSGQLAVLEYLIEQGAGLEPRGSDGGTPLTLALWHEQVEAARLLVASGADIDALDNWGGSPRSQVATL
ncbi:ankyrin repeat domain-containing protein [Herpetosiphon llansteffanensis]